MDFEREAYTEENPTDEIWAMDGGESYDLRPEQEPEEDRLGRARVLNVSRVRCSRL